jgi:predicted nucleic acid-binding protein
MPVKAFLDTNVLVYAFSLNDRRKGAAEDLLIRGGTVGVQTLNEFVNVATGKFKTSWPEVITWLAAIQRLCPAPVPVTLDVHRQAMRIAEIYHYHFYDSLMCPPRWKRPAQFFIQRTCRTDRRSAD